MLVSAACKRLARRTVAPMGVRSIAANAGGPMFGGGTWEDHGYEVSPINGAPKIPSPWNKWFPHEPVPFSPKQGPYKVHVERGEVYHWCACGQCVNQPWADAGGCQAPFKAVPFIPEFTGTYHMCGSKHSPSRPLFNGTCWLQFCDIYPVTTAFAGFWACFVGAVVLSWLGHP
eukprot:TRINITY_DN5985_c0_g1_i3.p2 TRINITY_DN5985_c0_g1~~TRINITY_DN5985_c0_g1_i3.p2  ORF type:complete len:173 (-),score=27.86 TRINITY_DN5985_c0_g1_i3:175-693(-)